MTFKTGAGSDAQSAHAGFDSMPLDNDLLRAISKSGYTTPSPIQSKVVPLLATGIHVMAQSQTGTGKTAAFALPLLARLDLKLHQPQVLVLAPTRELALQVSDSFKRYGEFKRGLSIAAIYGGQSYSTQLNLLRKGVQVVVGTPGRVMDHMRRGSLVLSSLDYLVLDEADEMLRMGFLEDVEWIVEHTPKACNGALFSATLPKPIRLIAQKFLTDPIEVSATGRSNAATTINQRYWLVGGINKADALSRILEVEDIDGVIVFVKTKTATLELSDELAKRGFKAVPLNGDIPQNQREQTVTSFKSGKTDIIVATDVAARGLDVQRVSHVINYDAPFDVESYIHRIGRTGRAGRSGEAILFLSSRESPLLRKIERATKQPIERIHVPTASDVNKKRVQKLKDRIFSILKSQDLTVYRNIILELHEESGVDLAMIGAAFGSLSSNGRPLLLPETSEKRRSSTAEPERRRHTKQEPERGRYKDSPPRRAKQPDSSAKRPSNSSSNSRVQGRKVNSKSDAKTESKGRTKYEERYSKKNSRRGKADAYTASKKRS